MQHNRKTKLSDIVMISEIFVIVNYFAYILQLKIIFFSNKNILTRLC